MSNDRKSNLKKALTFQNFDKYYGQFPYFIIQFRGCYMQLPIHFVNNFEDAQNRNYPGIIVPDVPEEVINAKKKYQIKLLHETLIEILRQMDEKSNGERSIWLVENKSTSYHMLNGQIDIQDKIPFGGTLVTKDFKMIAKYSQHYRSKNKKTFQNTEPSNMKRYYNTSRFKLKQYDERNTTFLIPKNLSEINAIHIKPELNNIRITDYERDNKNIIITFKGRTGISYMDFTNAADYRVYCFNYYGCLVSRHYALNNLSTFVISTSQKNILLARN